MTTIIPAEFTQSTSAHTLNLFLNQLQNETNNSFTIYQNVVSYPSLSTKQNQVNSQATPDEKAEYQACHHIQAVETKLKVHGTIFWLSGNVFHVGMSGNENPWHAYIVIYSNKRIIIVDPDYEGKTGSSRRFRDFNGLGLVRQLVDFINGRKHQKVGGDFCCAREVKDIRIGHTGFGFPKQNYCVKMSGQWLQNFVQNGCPMEWFNEWEVISK